MTIERIDDCCGQKQRESSLFSHECAIAELKARIVPIEGKATLSLAALQGRVCAEDTLAPRQVPGHANAAVDGYALAHASLSAEGSSLLKIVARAAAGCPHDGKIEAGEAARIFTGALVPEGCDTVVMQEVCEAVAIDRAQAATGPQGLVRILPGVRKGANIRPAGEDIGKSDTLLKAGAIIRPQDIAALASVGLSHVACFAQPRIAIVSSGEEIVRAGTLSLARGQIYDANAPMLLALAMTAGGTVTDLGVLPDDPETVVNALRAMARDFDLILTSGGAGPGEEDRIADAVRACGTCHFWHISIKPGKPLLFGQIGTTAIVGLPGNPVAAFVCFLMYAYPLIRRLGGAAWLEPRRFPLPANFEASKSKAGRREFWRGFIGEQAGMPVAGKYARDGSGLISSLRAADGLIDVPENVARVRQGDIVNFIPFSEFGII